MSLRARLTLVAAIVVAIVVAVASLVVYLTMRHDLRKQVDDELKTHAALIQRDPHDAFHDLSISSDFVQIVFANGGVQNTYGSGNAVLPIDAQVRAVVSRRQSYFLRDTVVQNRPFREVVAQLPFGAVMIARPLQDVDRELHRLGLILILVSLGGVGAAAIAGALVSRATLAPVRRLTAAAELIAQTQDPSERVPETGRGELARLGAAFNTMLGALDDALETQRRFVADASHELRTPLTSMQTNIDVLREQDRLDSASRERLLDDLQRESHEMRDLISGLLELARGGANLEHTTVQLDELVEAAVERARSRFPQVAFAARLEPTAIEGVPERLERAVWNLLENAGKWSEPGSDVEVTLGDGELRVRDHGPGIAPEDRAHVFDRFYRSASARARPGSGLGLAIVREVAEDHGGTVAAEEAPGGGALLRLRLDGRRSS